MDAISPEFRLDPTDYVTSIGSEWEIDDDHALMLHKPTHSIFSIYLAVDADPAAPTLYQFRARLAHVCDGQPIPDNIAAFGASAINAYACWTERVEILVPAPPRPMQKLPLADDDIPF